MHKCVQIIKKEKENENEKVKEREREREREKEKENEKEKEKKKTKKKKRKSLDTHRQAPASWRDFSSCFCFYFASDSLLVQRY